MLRLVSCSWGTSVMGDKVPKNQERDILIRICMYYVGTWFLQEILYFKWTVKLLNGNVTAGINPPTNSICIGKMFHNNKESWQPPRFSRYAWPNENEGPSTPTSKNLLCFKAWNLNHGSEVGPVFWVDICVTDVVMYSNLFIWLSVIE